MRICVLFASRVRRREGQRRKLELNLNQWQVEIRAVAQLTAASRGGGWGRAPALQVRTPHWAPVLLHGDVNAPDKTGSMARDLGWGLCAKDLLAGKGWSSWRLWMVAGDLGGLVLD